MATKVISKLPLLVSKKEVREGRNRRYTQKEIAEQSGVSPTVINRWMQGDEINGSTLETVQKLATWLGEPVEHLTEEVEI